MSDKKKTQLKDINTGDLLFPITEIDNVNGLTEEIENLWNKEDKDTVYDDSEIRKILLDIQKSLSDVSHITSVNLNEVITETIQDSFSNTNQKMYGDGGVANLLDYCAKKCTLETIVRLGTVRRTITFVYDSYIFYSEYSHGVESNYYNYTANAVLNNVLYMCRIQIYESDKWIIETSPIVEFTQK